MIHIGFTGSQHGMSNLAMRTLYNVFHDTYEASKFSSAPICLHHGDCIKSDEIAARIAKRLGYLIHAHPSFLDHKRAFSEDNDIIHAPKDPLERNEDIAKVSRLIVATPHTFNEVIRSGTWATIRRARMYKRKVCIIFPDGSEKWEKNDGADGREAT